MTPVRLASARRANLYKTEAELCSVLKLSFTPSNPFSFILSHWTSDVHIHQMFLSN